MILEFMKIETNFRENTFFLKQKRVSQYDVIFLYTAIKHHKFNATVYTFMKNQKYISREVIIFI